MTAAELIEILKTLESDTRVVGVDYRKDEYVLTASVAVRYALVDNEQVVCVGPVGRSIGDLNYDVKPMGRI